MITPVAHVSTFGGSASAGIDTTGADLLVLAYSRIAASGPADSYSNTWVLLRTQTAQHAGILDFYYVLNPVVGPGHTFSGAGQVSLCVAAFAGVSTTDQDTGVDVDAAPYQPGSLTPSEDNCLVISALGGGSTPDVESTGYTTTDIEPFHGLGGYACGVAYLIQTSAAATNSSWPQLVDNGLMAVIAASFKSAPAGPVIDSVVPDTFANAETGIVISGSNF